MKLDADSLDKIQQAQALVDAAYDNYFEKSDGHCKSGEGTLTVTGESYFDRQDGKGCVAIEIYSYIFGTGRRQRFETADEFLEWAKKIHAAEMAHDYSRNMWSDYDEDERETPR